MAHLLTIVPNQVIVGLGPKILVSTTQVQLSTTIDRLCTWIVHWPYAQETIAVWIKQITKFIYKSGRISIPTTVAAKKLPVLLGSLKVPVIRNGILLVTYTFFLSAQHTSQLFVQVSVFQVIITTV